MGLLHRVCPGTVYSLSCRFPFRLLITIHLSTRYASTEIGLIAPTLFRQCGAVRSFTGTSPTRIKGCVCSYNFCGDGTRSVINVTRGVLTSCGNRIPSGVSSLLALPKINEGATGLVINSVCNGTTVIISARYVHVAGELNLITRGSPGGVRCTLGGVVPTRRNSSFYREVILFNERIYATEGPGYSSYHLTRVYGGAKMGGG